MENKKYTKIKVTDSYGTTVIKKLPEDPNVDKMIQAFRDILLALGYGEQSINKYIQSE